MALGLIGVAALVAAVIQAPPASLAGTVKDGATGAPLAGAAVSLVELERTVFTDAAGRYLLHDVPSGPQHVLVRHIGYAPRTFHALLPAEGVLAIDVALRADPLMLHAIAVHGAIPVRGLEAGDTTGFPDRSLSLAAVRHDPLLAEPDVLQAAAGGEIVTRPESPSGLNVRGAASDHVAYLLDDIPVFIPYHAAGTHSAWNPDALARLDVATTTTSPALVDGLSGAVAATTRTPGAELRTQGALSITQARVTLDGPLAGTGAGFLASVRTAAPGLLFHEGDPTFVGGDGIDWLGKIESPALGGRLQVLGYGNENENLVASDTVPAATSGTPPRHTFAWSATSVGGGWTRAMGRATTLLFRAWSATADAGATWRATDTTIEALTARRRDAGVLVMMSHTGRTTTTAGIRAQLSRTSYRLRPDSGAGRSLSLGARTPVAAAFADHRRPIGSRTEIGLSLGLARAAGSVHLSPGLRLRWAPSNVLTLVGGYARRHQAAQSLRNPESVVANVFPADLFVGASRGGVAVARSDLGFAALAWRPRAGVRLGLQAWVQELSALALVAPRDADPFATTGYVTGSGRSRGAALELAANGARYAALASYGLQRVRFQYGDTSYVPDHGAIHVIDAGVVVFPTSSSSVRVAVSGLLGRRTTPVEGAFEWEACNLLDRGCQFAGTPRQRTQPLGSAALPAYLRLDIGVSKHWHFRVGNRDGQVALFGTITNLLDRRNALTIRLDPATGARQQIAMRPLAPLVVGLDWRF